MKDQQESRRFLVPVDSINRADREVTERKIRQGDREVSSAEAVAVVTSPAIKYTGRVYFIASPDCRRAIVKFIGHASVKCLQTVVG